MRLRLQPAVLLSALTSLAMATPALATEDPCREALILQAAPKLQGPGYYAILGLSRTATARQIKSAYRKLSRATHPDLPRNQSVEDGPRIQQDLNAAYQVLGDAKLRRKYDAALDSDDAVQEFYAAMARVYAPSEVVKNGARYQKDKPDEDIIRFVHEMMLHSESADAAVVERALRTLNEKASAWKAFTLPETIAHVVEQALLKLHSDRVYPYSDFARSVGGFIYNPKVHGNQKYAYAKGLAERLLAVIDRLPASPETEAARDQLKLFFLSSPMHKEHELGAALSRPLDRLMILLFALEPAYSVHPRDPIPHLSRPSWLQFQADILDQLADDPLTFARFSWRQRLDFASALDTLPLQILGDRMPARQFVQLIKLRFDLQDLLEKDAPLMNIYRRESLLQPDFKAKLFWQLTRYLPEPWHKHAVDTVFAYEWSDPEAAGRAIFAFSDLSPSNHYAAIERLMQTYLNPTVPDPSNRLERKLAALTKHRGVPLLLRQQASEASSITETRRLFIDSIRESLTEAKADPNFSRIFDIRYNGPPITRHASLGRDRDQISKLRLSVTELEELQTAARGTPFESAFAALKAARPAS